MKIAIADLRQKMIGTLGKSFSETDANRIADILLWADMSGVGTMGIAKMTGTEPIQNIKPQKDVTIERDTKLSQLIDAGGWPAPMVCERAADVAIEKAKAHGFAIVGVHGTYSSNTTQAYYVDRIARQDLIGIMLSRSPGMLAPFNSIDPLFGANPIGFGFPTEEEPLIFDMTSAGITWYGMLLAKARGEQLPEGTAIDKDGQPTTDPATAMHGAFLPFDRGHKGSGIGMVVELMAGPLAASAFCDYKTFDKDYGTTIVAIDPELLVDVATFKRQCSELIKTVKQSRPQPGTESVRLPGERSRAAYQAARASGMVDVESTILKELGYM
ncbi:MAG TPA: Ldh family oxidoreductase [Candidatus Saccharimonadales bacterium]|nr:Ldh family oxidoreductase [Candidatus Saccharimonadales bacterium]